MLAQRPRIAVADLGTNSTRLLVAELDQAGAIVELERLTEVTCLGDGVDASGRLTDDACERVVTCLQAYRDRAAELGATRRVAVATSAVRDAANGAQLEAAVRERAGFDVRTISGDEEARLTFAGATAGRAGDDRMLVVDIGGGSTELVIGAPRATPGFHVSTQLGSVRQTERHLTDDPPTADQSRALARDARRTIERAVPKQHRGGVDVALAVAGTATSLAAVDQQLEPYDPKRVDGYPLLLGECERMHSMLAGMTLAERRQVSGLLPARAPTIVAGVAILIATLETFGLEQITVSEADILHGAALKALGDS